MEINFFEAKLKATVQTIDFNFHHESPLDRLHIVDAWSKQVIFFLPFKRTFKTREVNKR